jgi:hypothetical protein
LLAGGHFPPLAAICLINVLLCGFVCECVGLCMWVCVGGCVYVDVWVGRCVGVYVLVCVCVCVCVCVTKRKRACETCKSVIRQEVKMNICNCQCQSVNRK